MKEFCATAQTPPLTDMATTVLKTWINLEIFGLYYITNDYEQKLLERNTFLDYLCTYDTRPFRPVCY